MFVCIYATNPSMKVTASANVSKQPGTPTTWLFSILRTPNTAGATFLMSYLPSNVDQQVDVSFTMFDVVVVVICLLFSLGAVPPIRETYHLYIQPQAKTTVI